MIVSHYHTRCCQPSSVYRYLRLQGYSEKDITILAMYKDQVLLLRHLIKKVKTFNERKFVSYFYT
jgi:hypothetical protein